MKKRNVIIVIILLLIGILAWNIYKHVRLQYQVTEVQNPQFFVMKQEEKSGVINAKGEVVLAPTYQEVQIPNAEKEVFLCYAQAGDTATVLNAQQQTLYTNFADVEAIVMEGITEKQTYETNRLIYQQDGKYGLLAIDGTVITKPLYDEIKSIGTQEGIYRIKQGEVYGVMNGKGTIVIKPQYDSIRYSAMEPAGFIVNTKTEEGYRYGFINTKGKKIVDTQYSSLERVMPNKKKYYFIAYLDGQAGVLENKKKLVPHAYSEITYHESDDIFIAERNQCLGAFDTKGKEIVPTTYENVYAVGEYINAEIDGKKEIYDKTGKKLEDTTYIGRKATSNNKYTIVVDKDNHYGVVGNDGTVYIECTYDYIEYITGDYFLASRDGKTGVITQENKSVVELKYSALTKLEGMQLLQGTLKTQETTTIDILNYSMQKVASLENGILEIEEGYVKLYSMENVFYIDYKGTSKAAKEVLGNLPLYASRENGKWGFMNNNGTLQVDYQYDRVTQFNRYGYAGIYANGKWGVIGKNGEIVLEPTYSIEDTIEPDFIGTYYQKVSATGEIYYTK